METMAGALGGNIPAYSMRARASLRLREASNAHPTLRFTLPCPLPSDPPNSTCGSVTNQKPLNIFGEFDLRVIYRLVAQDLAGVGQRPESARVVANAVHHLP